MKQEYIICTDKSVMDVNAIHAYLTRSYWAKDIPHHIVSASIKNSLCFGVFYNKQQVGFARLVTDYATFAYLCDVYILEEHRGKGLSKKLMKKIISYPRLQNQRRIILATNDAHTLYEKFGFKQLSNSEMFMEIRKTNVYIGA